jgi:hypothetical protein
MPRGDGTGPLGKGSGIGAGKGGAAGAGRGATRGGSMGPPVECVCPQCGDKVPHERGVPCFQQQCPKCGTAMTRG